MPDGFRPTMLCLLFGIVALASCDSGTAPSVSRDGFTVTASRGFLTLRNETPHAVHFVAIEEESSALVDLNPDPTAWPAVPPNGEVRVAYEDIDGYAPGARRVRVYWWTAGEYRESLVLDLR